MYHLKCTFTCQLFFNRIFIFKQVFSYILKCSNKIRRQYDKNAHNECTKGEMLSIPTTCIEWGVNHKYVSLHDRESVSKILLYSVWIQVSNFSRS